MVVACRLGRRTALTLQYPAVQRFGRGRLRLKTRVTMWYVVVGHLLLAIDHRKA